jgi:hypothetical protein
MFPISATVEVQHIEVQHIKVVQVPVLTGPLFEKAQERAEESW